MLTDVSKSVSAVSFVDLDLDENDVGGAMSWAPPNDGTAFIETYETYLATDAAGSGGALAGSTIVPITWLHKQPASHSSRILGMRGPSGTTSSPRPTSIRVDLTVLLP